MSRFSAAEAEFLFDAALTFLGGKLGYFDGVYNHSIGVMVFVVEVLEKE